MGDQDRSAVPQRSRSASGIPTAITTTEALAPQPNPIAKAVNRSSAARLVNSVAPRTSNTAATNAMANGTEPRTKPEAKAMTAAVIAISFAPGSFARASSAIT